jgi:hypothetical protein
MCWIATVSGFTHQHYTLILVSKAMRLEGGVGDSLKKTDERGNHAKRGRVICFFLKGAF